MSAGDTRVHVKAFFLIEIVTCDVDMKTKEVTDSFIITNFICDLDYMWNWYFASINLFLS